MKRLFTSCVLAIAAAALSPLPVLAQDVQNAAETSRDTVYSRLYEVIVTSVSLEVSTRQVTVDSVDELLETDPVLAQVQAEQPDFRKDLITVFYPYLLDMSRRVQAQYRPQYINLLESELTEAEAGMMLELFDSPVGRKLTGGLARNFRSERTMREAMDGEEITRESIQSDNRETAQRSVAQLTQDDLMELGRFAERYPQLLPTFQRLNPLILDIRVRMDNELPTAEEERLLMGELAELYARYGLDLAI